MVETFVEVTLRTDEDFLKVKETLTRIGVASRREQKLFQSCHILHKQGQYYIVHFKELFKLDGKPSNFDEVDLARRNTIANMLAEWELVDLLHEEPLEPTVPLKFIKILSYDEKEDWELVPKYNIGKKY